MKIPVEVDWQSLLIDLRASTQWSDDRVCDELSMRYGICVDRSTIWLLRHGRRSMPMWTLGAALLNLYAINR